MATLALVVTRERSSGDGANESAKGVYVSRRVVCSDSHYDFI